MTTNIPKSLNDYISEISIAQASLKVSISKFCPQSCLNAAFHLTSYLKLTLPAKEYYQLFLQIFDGLFFFSDHLHSLKPSNELYIASQYCIDVLPRLYTMVTVGISIYEITQSHELIEDLLDMVKGVQHPLRGLFLRYYFNKKMKGLHIENSKYSISFILKNLSAMNSLWSRIESLEERDALKITVGENIERLSVVCTNSEIYIHEVFPQCIQILESSDLTSQQYLLDCVVQAFPDEFLLKTCNEFLEVASKIQCRTDIIELVYNSLRRLLEYLREIGTEFDEKCYDYVKMYLESVSGCEECKDYMKRTELIAVVFRLLKKSERAEMMSEYCLDSAWAIFQGGECSALDKLMEILLCALGISLKESIGSESFHKLFERLEVPQKKKVAHKIIDLINAQEQAICDMGFWNKSFNCLDVIANAEFLDEKLLIIRILHKIQPFSYEFAILVFQKFQQDEAICSSLSFLCMKNIGKCSVLSKVLYNLIDKFQNKFLALQILINTIVCFNKNQTEFSPTELVEKFARIYEDITDNSNKIHVLYGIIGCIVELKDCEVKVDRLVSCCYRLPKKNDQCIIILALSHIFWSDSLKDPDKLIENLKRAVKLADLCVTGTKNLELFLKILNVYLHFFIRQVPTIEVTSINSLIELIFELLGYEYEKDLDLRATQRYLLSTLQYIINEKHRGNFQRVNADYKIQF